MPATPAGAKPLWHRFLLFLGPLVLTNVLQALSGTLNTIYLGQMLGTRAMAAAVAFFPLLMLCISFVIGLGTGTSIVIGQAWGGKDVDKVRRIAGTSLFGGALLGVAVGAVGFAGIGHVLQGLGTPPDILVEATAYARVLLFGLPVLFVFMLAAAVLRGTGDTVTPLRTLLVSCVVTMTLTPALIRGWIGLPPLGAVSAAWANVISWLAGLGWLAWHLARRQHAVSPRALRGHFRIDRDLLRIVVRLGIPTALFFVTSSLADIGLLSLVNAHGSHATAAWGAVNQVMAYVQFPAISIAVAASVFTAQAIGAGQFHEVDHAARVGLWLNLLLPGTLALVAVLVAPYAVGLFIREPEVVALAASVLRITVWTSVIFGLASVYSGVMRAAGTVKVPTLISLCCLVFLLFPMGWLFDRLLGVKGIWLAYPIAYGCGLALQAAYFYGVWKRRPITKLV
jgi:putative MATE family efflux protein